MQSIASKLNDGHTMVFPNYAGSLFYPFMYIKLGDAYYLQTSSKEFESSIAKQIIAVNGAPIDDVIQSFRPSLSCENEVDFANKIRKQMAFSTIWDYTPYKSADSTLTLTFLDSSSIVITPAKTIQKEMLVSFKPSKPATSGLRERSQMPFLYKIVENKGVCYLQFQTCADQNSIKWSLKQQGKMTEEQIEQFAAKFPAFDKFLDTMFSEIASKNIQKLIVDVRDNSGGNSSLCDMLLSWLKPVNEVKTGSSTIRFSKLWEASYKELFEKIRQDLTVAGLHYERGTMYSGQQLSAISNPYPDTAVRVNEDEYFRKNSDTNRIFNGEVVFIQNEDTYSSAGMLITAAIDNNIGTLIGSKSSYRPTNYGDMLGWELPNTCIKGFVSHKIFYRPNSAKKDEPSIVPDVVVEQTWEDIRNMRDVYIEQALNN